MKVRSIPLAIALVGLMAGTAAAQVSDLKIGVLTEISGLQASSGTGERNGVEFYLSQVGGKIAGRTVDLIVEDTAGDPSTAIAKAKKLVESDKVDFLIGPNNSATAAAIKGYVSERGIPTFVGATVDEVSDGKFIFRTTSAANSETFLQGYLAGHAGYKKAVIVVPNYTAGQSTGEYMGKGFTAAGGQVLRELMPRLGTADFGSIIAQIPDDADVALVFMPGTDGVRFLKQFADYGSHLPLYGAPSTVDENLLPAEGKAAVGFVGAAFYFSSIDTPENRKFMQGWEAKFKNQERPAWPAVGGYIAAEIIDRAMQKIGGNITNMDTLLTAIKTAQLVTPSGNFHFDERNNPVQPRYVMQIREVDGAAEPVVLGVIPEFNAVPAAPQLPSNLHLPK